MNKFVKGILVAVVAFFTAGAFALDSASPINVSVTMPDMFKSTVTLTITNTSPAPRAVLVQIFNQESENLVSEVAVNVPANSSVNVEAEPISGESFAKKIKFRYHYTLGKFVAENKDNRFQIPFPEGVSASVCQSPDGPIKTHQKRMKAIDFCAKEKTQIVAAKDGEVIEVTDFYTEGGPKPELLNKANRIIVLHDDGLYTSYVHIYPKSARVKIGDKVVKGQPIALVGNVGYSYGAHLHFELVETLPSVESINMSQTITPNFYTPSNQPIGIKYKGVYSMNGLVGAKGVQSSARIERVENQQAAPRAKLMPTKIGCENDCESDYTRCKTSSKSPTKSSDELLDEQRLAEATLLCFKAKTVCTRRCG